MSKTDTARKIVGDNSKLGRSELDFYPTPPNATIELLKREKFNGDIWECACGRGDISVVLKEFKYNVISSDIKDYGYGETGIDFLKINDLYCDNIITNPPFKLALEFILKAKKLSKNKIAMFLKTTFLEGIKRYDMFQDQDFALKTVYQFSKRVNFGKSEGTHKNGGMIAFAWFVWDKGYNGKPTIEWIK